MANYQSSLTGSQINTALQKLLANEAEGWAEGTNNGTPVGSGSPYYQNNAKYYASLAQGAVPSDTTDAVKFNVDQSGTLNDTQKSQARKNIMAGGTNPSLLDNPWFSVNQRGITSGNFPNGTYYMDRWQTTYGTASNVSSWTLSSGILTVTTGSSAAYFQQPVSDADRINGKQITGSVMFSDGSILSGTITRSNGTTQNFASSDGLTIAMNTANKFSLNFSANKTKEIKAVKLELGPVSTLHNDVAPDYPTELAKCQYYFERITATGANLSLGVGNTGTTATTFYLPIKIAPKRTATPTLSKSGNIKLGTSSLSITASSFAWLGFDQNTGFGTLNITIPSGQSAGAILRCGLEQNAYINISSDL